LSYTRIQLSHHKEIAITVQPLLGLLCFFGREIPLGVIPFYYSIVPTKTKA